MYYLGLGDLGYRRLGHFFPAVRNPSSSHGLEDSQPAVAGSREKVEVHTGGSAWIQHSYFCSFLVARERERGKRPAWTGKVWKWAPVLD